MLRKKLHLYATGAALGLLILFGNANPVTAANSPETYSETTKVQASDESVIVITTAEQLIDFATNSTNYRSKTVRLGCDITLDKTLNNIKPICEGVYNFSGTFDGCGYTISGVNISKNSDNIGLFGSVTGTVKNLTLENCYFRGRKSVGAIAGNATGGKIINCHVRNSIVTATNIYAGGISGNNGRIANCSSNASVSGFTIAGGIVGYKGTAENCYNLGTVTTTEKYAGGINGHAATLKNCYNAGEIIADARSGGIIGNASGSNVSYCYSTGDSPLAGTGTINNTNSSCTPEYMTSVDFLNVLNTNTTGNNEWISWEIREGSPYPQHRKLIKMETCTATVTSQNIVYTGAPQTPDVVVTYNGITLVKDVDYTLTYSNNINAGTGTVDVAGLGLYCGYISTNFPIAKGNTVLTCSPKYNTTIGSRSFPINVHAESGNYHVQYTSSDPGVASVDSSGYVTVSGIGIATITISAAETENYNGASISTSVVVSPKQQSMSLSMKKKRFKVKWTKDSMVSGYQIQYARNAAFTKKCKTVTIRKKNQKSYLGKKVTGTDIYYVRVRSFKDVTVNGKKEVLYGAWSVSDYIFAEPDTPKPTLKREIWADYVLKNNINDYSNISSAEIKWKKVSGVSGYEVHIYWYGDDDRRNYGDVIDVKKTGKTYQYKLTDSSGNWMISESAASFHKKKTGSYKSKKLALTVYTNSPIRLRMVAVRSYKIINGKKYYSVATLKH